MAKQKIISKTEMSFDIDINSKDYDYKYTTTEKTQVSFIIKNFKEYIRNSYLIRDGQNLKFIVVYTNQTTKKIITNTLLDYYTHAQKYEGDQVISNITPDVTYTQASGITYISSPDNKYAGSNKNDTFIVTNTGNYIIDFNGNDTYKIKPLYNTNTHNTIRDYKGNDKYIITSVSDFIVLNISDHSGNDTYSFTNRIYSYLYDYAGNDTYNFYSSRGNINDYVGKDTYNVNCSSRVYITDEGGNDTYNVNNSFVNFTDKNKGNEIYNLSGLYSDSWIEDYEGKDKYFIDYATGTNDEKIEIRERQGNDTYSISGSKYINLREYNGNDKYTIKNSENLTITDNVAEGSSANKDSYDIIGVKNSTITDANGNDTYKIKFSESMTVTENGGTDNYVITGSVTTKITDSSSNTKESYTVKSSNSTTITSSSGDDTYSVSDDSIKTVITDSEGNEKYTVKNTDYLKITDSTGNDTYNFTDVDNLNSEFASEYCITDNDDSDKYTIKDSRFVYVFDKTTGENIDKDIYNITNSENIQISDKSNSLFTSEKFESNTYNVIGTKNLSITTNEEGTDFASVDTYNVKTSSGEIKDYDNAKDTYSITSSSISILDAGDTSDDTYKFDKLNGNNYINDCGGDKDSILFTGKKNNFIFMLSDGYFDTEGERHKDGTLYIYDKINKGFVGIDNYFKLTDEYLLDYGLGKGAIENIKIGKTGIDDVVEDYSLYYTMQGVASWVHNKGFTTIGSILESNDSALINELVLKFTP